MISDKLTLLLRTINRHQFVLFFVLCCLQYSFIQLILPFILPELFEGGGLLKMSKDSKVFHQLALQKAQEIHEFGWRSWELRPQNQAPSGIASALYYFFPSLALTIPLCALLQTFSALTLGKIVREFNFSAKVVFLVSLLFVLHPISLQWNSQHHKDTYAILGILLIILGFLRLHTAASLKNTVLDSIKYMLPGFALVWLVRPYLIEIFVLAISGSIVISFVLNRKNSLRSTIPLILIVAGMGWMFFSSRSNIVIKGYKRAKVPQTWESSSEIPGIVDRKLQAFAKNRRAYILENGHKNTSIRTGKNLENSFEVIQFLPQAFLDSLIQPIPFAYVNKEQNKGSYLMGLVAGVDILISYFLIIFFFHFVATKRKASLIHLCFMVFTFMTVMGFSFPNLGTLYRMRYPFYMIIVALGFSQAYELMPLLKKWFYSKVSLINASLINKSSSFKLRKSE